MISDSLHSELTWCAFEALDDSYAFVVISSDDNQDEGMHVFSRA